jgi:hypothetical protein
MDAPIFVVGANRSGTTLLRLILNAHSRIAIPEELVYVTAHTGNRGIDQWRDPGYTQDHYRFFIERFLEDNAETLAPLDLDALADRIASSTTPNLRSPYQMALEAWARQQGKERWGEKTPSNIFYAEHILDMFPDAQFIHLIRDPRAGVASMQNVRFFPNDLIFNALNRKKYLTTGQSHLEKCVPANQRLIVRYEDLVRHPESVTESICSFLGEDFEPSMLEFYKESKRYMKEEAAQSFNQAATQPISSSKASKWKERLEPRAVAAIENVCRAQMARYGYARSNLPLPLEDRIMVWIKTFYWHLQNWRNRDNPHFLVKDPMFNRTRQRLRHLVNLASTPFHLNSSSRDESTSRQ